MRLNYKTYLVDLPLTMLHVLEVGSGPPLIVVPATISELENWAEMMEFMAQWFRVFFFELPGHGRSTPFQSDFSTHKVAHTVADFVRHQGFERFNLMGFSFGGILVMRTFHLLRQQVDRVFLLAPCLTNRAVLLPPAKLAAAKLVNRALVLPSVQTRVYETLRDEKRRRGLMNFFSRFSPIEHPDQITAKLAKVPLSTINVLSHQFKEVFKVEFPHPPQKYSTPAFFAMSARDPLLDYGITLDEMNSHFEQVSVKTLDYPFHQPPQPLTFDELNNVLGNDIRNFIGSTTAF